MNIDYKSLDCSPVSIQRKTGMGIQEEFKPILKASKRNGTDNDVFAENLTQ